MRRESPRDAEMVRTVVVRADERMRAKLGWRARVLSAAEAVKQLRVSGGPKGRTLHQRVRPPPPPCFGR